MFHIPPPFFFFFFFEKVVLVLKTGHISEFQIQCSHPVFCHTYVVHQCFSLGFLITFYTQAHLPTDLSAIHIHHSLGAKKCLGSKPHLGFPSLSSLNAPLSATAPPCCTSHPPPALPWCSSAPAEPSQHLASATGRCCSIWVPALLLVSNSTGPTYTKLGLCPQRRNDFWKLKRSPL